MNKVLLILISLVISYSELLVYNSYYSKTTSIAYDTFTFGDPALLTIYGRASFISAYPNYPRIPSLNSAFAVFSNYQTYSMAKLSLLAQKNGAVGAVFVSQSSGWTFKSIENDPNDEKQINIVVIKMLKADAEKLKSYRGSLWLMYKYDIEQKSTSKIKLHLNGNYTQDRDFVQALLQLNTNILLQKANLEITINSLNSSDSRIVVNNDCMSYKDTYLCMKATSGVNGRTKVINSIMILKYFDFITDLGQFFGSLISLFNTCESDYSQACISGQLTNIPKATPEDVDQYTIKFNQKFSFTMCMLNSDQIYWPSYLELAYCLSFFIAPSACKLCSASCSYPSLTSNHCNSACNVSSCSFNNLNCINNNGCYNFLLGEGRCDFVCTNDPDCTSGDVCAFGCLYSDMKNGYCPLACAGACFSNCNNDYCSPNCLYNDLYTGICSSDCTDDCKKKCPSSVDICSPGCLYSDMKDGKCPADCTEICFSNCNTELYCSPGCTYDSLHSGNCSEHCSNECLDHCNRKCPPDCNERFSKSEYCPEGCTSECCRKKNVDSSSANLNLVFVLVPIFGGLLILTGLCCCCWYKRNKQKGHSPIALPAAIILPDDHDQAIRIPGDEDNNPVIISEPELNDPQPLPNPQKKGNPLQNHLVGQAKMQFLEHPPNNPPAPVYSQLGDHLPNLLVHPINPKLPNHLPDQIPPQSYQVLPNSPKNDALPPSPHKSSNYPPNQKPQPINPQLPYEPGNQKPHIVDPQPLNKLPKFESSPKYQQPLNFPQTDVPNPIPPTQKLSHNEPNPPPRETNPELLNAPQNLEPSSVFSQPFYESQDEILLPTHQQSLIPLTSLSPPATNFEISNPVQKFQLLPIPPQASDILKNDMPSPAHLELRNHLPNPPAPATIPTLITLTQNREPPQEPNCPNNDIPSPALQKLPNYLLNPPATATIQTLIPLPQNREPSSIFSQPLNYSQDSLCSPVHQRLPNHPQILQPPVNNPELYTHPQNREPSLIFSQINVHSPIHQRLPNNPLILLPSEMNPESSNLPQNLESSSDFTQPPRNSQNDIPPLVHQQLPNNPQNLPSPIIDPEFYNPARQVPLQLPDRIMHPELQNTELIHIIFDRNIDYRGDPRCSIDQKKFKKGDAVILTPCKHLFHPKCINDWLERVRNEKTCPNCNSPLPRYRS